MTAEVTTYIREDGKTAHVIPAARSLAVGMLEAYGMTGGLNEEQFERLVDKMQEHVDEFSDVYGQDAPDGDGENMAD